MKATHCRTLSAAASGVAVMAAMIGGLASPHAQAGPSAATGRIAGRVVSGADRRPVRLAVVTLSSPAMRNARAVVTDDFGRFSFAAIPAGRFTLSASKAAHITTAYGARRPGRPGTPVALADGQTLDNLTIDLPRGAVITGTVRDQLGQPLPGIAVAALDARVRPVAGVVVRPEQVRTDDRGVYRIFGLMPGEYVIEATGRITGTGEMGAMTERDVDAAMQSLRSAGVASAPDIAAALAKQATFAFANSFHPSAISMADAARLRVDAGEERGGVDITLQLVRAATVEGTVELNGVPGQSVRLSLEGDAAAIGSALNLLTTGAVVDAAGGFQFRSITPGRYRIVARTSAPRGGPPVPPMWAMADVTVSGDDVSGIALTLRPGLRVTGRVKMVGNDPSPPSPDQLVIRLGPETPPRPAGTVETSLTNLSATATVAADGTFSIAGVLPGRYKLSVGTSVRRAGWTTESAVANRRDVLDYGLTIEDDVEIAITYSNRQTELSGSLQTPAGLPAPGYFVIVFPGEQALWRPGARRVQSTRPDTSGRFSFHGLPPGEYRIAAVTDLDGDQLTDPELLAELIPASVAVTLTRGARTIQDLRIAR